ncbi:MAG: hypothetical protein KAJ39_03125 [Gammaproteobacteria bacterium]|nr:hypothetical protein [Gammaproteobacteria bacterium]
MKEDMFGIGVEVRDDGFLYSSQEIRIFGYVLFSWLLWVYEYRNYKWEPVKKTKIASLSTTAYDFAEWCIETADRVKVAYLKAKI